MVEAVPGPCISTDHQLVSVQDLPMSSTRLTFSPAIPRDGYAAVAGEVDAHSVDELVRWLDTIRRDGHGEMQLDLSGTEFLDSAGLQALVEQTRAFRDRGGRLVLLTPSDPVRRVLGVAGVFDELEVEDEVAPS